MPSSKAPEPCPACGSPLARPFVCSACGALFKEPAGFDHFSFFGLPVTFDVDPAELENSYLELSRLLHPDRQIARGKALPGESPDARRLRALALSATMNQAYGTLRDPAKRAEYLVRLRGGAGPEKDKRTPEGFLPQMLELREEIEDAKAGPDRRLLTKRRGEIAARRERTLETVRGLLVGEPDAGALSQARVELNALKYFSNLLEELDQTHRA